MEIVYDAIIKVMIIGILAWAISDTAREFHNLKNKEK